MTTKPEVVWQNDDIRIVVWYETIKSDGTATEFLNRRYVIEKVETKDALGEPNWRKIIVPNGISEIIDELLDRLSISREKHPDNEQS
jgi:hypothetical protein